MSGLSVLYRAYSMASILSVRFSMSYCCSYSIFCYSKSWLSMSGSKRLEITLRVRVSATNLSISFCLVQNSFSYSISSYLTFSSYFFFCYFSAYVSLTLFESEPNFFIRILGLLNPLWDPGLSRLECVGDVSFLNSSDAGDNYPENLGYGDGKAVTVFLFCWFFSFIVLAFYWTDSFSVSESPSSSS